MLPHFRTKNMLQHRARKRFGQNFLQDPNVLRKIVESIAPQKGDRVVEIGPGLGALTHLLLLQVGEIDVVELDRDLIPRLKKHCESFGKLNIFEADILKFCLNDLVQDQKKLRLVGNLPYNISTPLLFKLFSNLNIIQDMHFMFQQEVAERLSAEAGSKSYGRLSIMAQYFCRIELLFRVKPESFSPKPKVTSAFVRLVPHETLPYPVKDFALFEKMVKTAFTKRRKTIKNALKDLQMLPDHWIDKMPIDPCLRPEQISLQQYAMLSNLFAQD